MFSTRQRDFPAVVGTGFLVSRHGIVCTCRHVADAFPGLPKPADFTGIPALALLFRAEPATGNWGFIPIDITSVGYATVTGDITGYAGPRPPDVALLRLGVTDTPFLWIADPPIVEGEEVGIAGFPMGTDLFKAPGWLHQITPTLLSGIVSAVLPHHLHPTPHGLIVHAQTLGGSSGSPVFRPDGSVLGMVYAGVTQQGGMPTSLALCVSRDMIAGTISPAEASAVAAGKRQPLADRIANSTKEARRLGDEVLELWPGSGKDGKAN